MPCVVPALGVKVNAKQVLVLVPVTVWRVEINALFLPGCLVVHSVGATW